MYLGDKSLVGTSGVGCRAIHRRHEHGLTFSCGGGSVAKQDQSLELTTTERRARIVNILAGGLVRLKRRGTLGVSGVDSSETSLPDFGDLVQLRLESSLNSRLTVSDG